MPEFIDITVLKDYDSYAEVAENYRDDTTHLVEHLGIIQSEVSDNQRIAVSLREEVDRFRQEKR